MCCFIIETINEGLFYLSSMVQWHRGQGFSWNLNLDIKCYTDIKLLSTSFNYFLIVFYANTFPRRNSRMFPYCVERSAAVSQNELCEKLIVTWWPSRGLGRRWRARRTPRCTAWRIPRRYPWFGCTPWTAKPEKMLEL